MLDLKSPTVSSRIKQLFLFRILCVLLWPVDIFSFLLAPVWVFILVALLHANFGVRYYRLVYWYLVSRVGEEDRQRVK